jgi:predicted Zn finger-like uncharacterized protein
MIVTCDNCKKKFNVKSSVIPENGRLLQCNNCNHKWFFKKEIINNPIPPVSVGKLVKKIEPALSETIELLDTAHKDKLTIENVLNEGEVEKKETNKVDKNLKLKSFKNNRHNLLIITIVFIISFIAVIIILDTFQKPIANIFPNIEVILYNLYETINDIVLFLNNLI